LTNVSEVQTAFIIRAMMMEAVHTSETAVNFNMTTWHYIPEDCNLHTCYRENLKSHNYELWLHYRPNTMPSLRILQKEVLCYATDIVSNVNYGEERKKMMEIDIKKTCYEWAFVHYEFIFKH
jgi:hypothetical protein